MLGTRHAQAEQTPDAVRDKVVAAKLKCAGALAALEAKKYKTAASKFTEARAPPPGCLRAGETCDSLILLLQLCLTQHCFDLHVVNSKARADPRNKSGYYMICLSFQSTNLCPHFHSRRFQNYMCNARVSGEQGYGDADVAFSQQQIFKYSCTCAGQRRAGQWLCGRGGRGGCGTLRRPVRAGRMRKRLISRILGF